METWKLFRVYELVAEFASCQDAALFASYADVNNFINPIDGRRSRIEELIFITLSENVEYVDTFPVGEVVRVVVVLSLVGFQISLFDDNGKNVMFDFFGLKNLNLKSGVYEFNIHDGNRHLLNYLPKKFIDGKPVR